MSPAKAISLLIILSNMLFNSVLASTHLAVEHHGSYETPHIHIMAELNHQHDGTLDQDETEESHFHLMTLSAESEKAIFTHLHSFKATSLSWFSINQTYSPPIPPPTFSA